MKDEEIQKAKILIIDDQRLHIGLLEDILKSAGYENIDSTTDPQEGIEFYRDKNPDLILLDLEMPKIDGFSVIEQLKEIAGEERIPLLALSPDRSHEICLKALEAGAMDFIEKPYEGIEVLVRIRNIIEAQFLNIQVRNQNKILEEKVKERTKELTDTRLDIIRRLAMAAECRDEDTGSHIIRMSKLCVKLGRATGLNEEDCDLLLNASPLHDVGKIGIPDSILFKPGKLDAEEWEIMKSHTVLAAGLLSGSNSELMKMAEIVALTHHEKWDGSGYPKGLKGEDIPLVGRIVAICDVFDALLSKRPYKKAWTIDDALAEIEYSSGKHFDPNLTEFFSEIVKKDRKEIERDYRGEREE